MKFISTKVKALVSSLSLLAATFVIGTAMVSAAPAVVFNNGSGVDGIGEEKNFLRIKDANGSDTTEACTEDQTVDLWFYVHNTNPTELNGANNDGIGVAKNTKVDVDFKNAGYAKSQEILASVKADNSALATDNAFITCQGQEISLEYVSQAMTTNAPQWNVPYTLTGNIMDNATLGYNGIVPGCFEYRAYITVKVKIHVKKAPVTPIYSCDLLTVTKLADNKFRFNVSYTASNGATFKNVSYDFGDGAKKDDVATADHTYTELNNSKNVTVTTNFTVDGKTVSKTSEKCASVVSFVKKPVTPPTELPNTGAGSTIAIFLGASFIGAFLYRMRVLRGSN